MSSNNDQQGVIVFGEFVQSGQANRRSLNPVTLELLAKGRELADTTGETLSCILIGSDDTAISNECILYGADKVYRFSNPDFFEYNNEIHTEIAYKIASELKPSIMLFAGTMTGKEVAARIAVRLGTGLTADCTELDIDPDSKKLLQTRPAFGGNILATIICPRHFPQIATVRPHVFKKAQIQHDRRGEIFDLEHTMVSKPLIRTISFKRKREVIDISESEIIIAGGYGLQKAENFILLEKLARLMGGTVAASRAVVDAGWIGSEYQVGQTGLTVSPRLYLACGISGSIQHLVGMQTSEMIVAINKDRNAPIFKVAHYGMIGDVLEIVSSLINQLEKKLEIEVR